MILTIPGGASQTWGSEILLNVTEIAYPVDAINPGLFYQVLFKVSRGVDYSQIILNTSRQDSGIGYISLDIAPYIASAGIIKIEWGQKYRNLSGWVTQWFDSDIRFVEIVDSTIVVTGQMTIPGGAVQLSGNPIEIIVTTTNEAMSGKTNYKLAVKVTCDELMGSPYVEEIAPLALVSKFDISGFVDQPVDYDFTYPPTGWANPRGNLTKWITIDVGAVWNDANGDRQVSWTGLDTDNEIIVTKGKLRQYELGLLNEVGKNFASEYINGGKFLTHLPNNQVVSPDHFIFMWYLSRWTDNHDVTAHFSMLTDQEVQPEPIVQDFMLWDITGLVEFALNWRHLGYWGAGKLLQFTFWLTDKATGVDVSDRRTFIVDNDYYEMSATFYYTNPLSGIDMLWLTGNQHIEGLKTESVTSYRPVPPGSGSKTASIKTVSSSGQRTWEINTGHKTPAEMRSMRDFLESSERWMVDPENAAKLIPVYIESGDWVLVDSMEDLHSMVIKVMEA